MNGVGGFGMAPATGVAPVAPSNEQRVRAAAPPARRRRHPRPPACGRALALRSGPCCWTARARCMCARCLRIGGPPAGLMAAAHAHCVAVAFRSLTPRLTLLASTPAPHSQVARKRQLTDELVQIRTQKAEVLRQIQAIAKRQKTGGLPTKAAELLAGNNKLVLQMEQRNRAEKVRRRLPSVLRACCWPAGCAATGCSTAAKLRQLAMQRAKPYAALAATRSVVVLLLVLLRSCSRAGRHWKQQQAAATGAICGRLAAALPTLGGLPASCCIGPPPVPLHVSCL